MKCRTTGQLEQFLARSLAWRKKELTLFRFCIDTAPDTEQRTLLRAGISLLYAHWEGYVKEAGCAYLRHIDLQHPTLADLKDNFVAICLKTRIRGAGQAQTVAVHSQLVQLMRSGLNVVGTVPWSGTIRTRANLKAAVLRDIVETLGLDYTPFEVKEKAIIDRLVALRNAIAHGRGSRIDAATYSILHSGTIEMLDEIKDQIEASAASRAYEA